MPGLGARSLTRSSPTRSLADLWELTYYDLAPRLYRLPGVAETRIVGGRPREYHVIVDPEWYDLLKEPSEDEDDMLDLAFNLTKTSRLGCQIIITEELDGLTVRLPAATGNPLFG